MRVRPRWTLLTLGALLVVLLFSYPVLRKLIPSRAASTVDFALASEAQRAVFAQMRQTPGAAATTYAAMLINTFVAPTGDAPTPDSSVMTAIKSGEFIQIDAIHSAKGHATLYRRPDDSLLLRFDDFSITNGPTLNVYLSTAVLPKTAAELQTGQSQISLGPLRGTIGSQNYTRVPLGLDLTRWKSVVIYSEDLKTVYSSATLS